MIHESKEYEEVEFLSKKILDLNKQLIQSEKTKSSFLSLVANELNNPMTALLGLIPHLNPSIDEAHKKIFDLIHQEAHNLNFRVQNLVAAAEIENGHIDTVFDSVDIGEVLREVIDDLHFNIKGQNNVITIHNTLDSNVITNPQKIYLILKNVISNASQYGHMSGFIDIEVSVVSSTLVAVVRNQGDGPNVEFKPQIFTRFAPGPEGKHGLGIGLSIVRELCESLDGTVDYTVDEEWVTFTITLPLQEGYGEYGSNEFLFESFNGAVEL